VGQIQETFQQSAFKLTYQGSHELQLPQMTVWHVLQKILSMKYYKLQLLQTLKPDDRVKQCKFCMQIEADMEDDEFATHLIFSDEAMLHLSRKVNHHNVHVGY
jgi:hypothetical protein